MATEVDKVFVGFCKKIGVANVREYEGESLAEQQKAMQKKAQFAEVIAKLQASIVHNKSQSSEKEVRVCVCVCTGPKADGCLARQNPTPCLFFACMDTQACLCKGVDVRYEYEKYA